MYYDIDGSEITIEDFTALFMDPEYRRIAQTYVGQALVSTVWLGINHSWDDGRPLIFETMIFPGNTTGEELSWRYPTLERAIAGHHHQVEILELEASLA